MLTVVPERHVPAHAVLAGPVQQLGCGADEIVGRPDMRDRRVSPSREYARNHLIIAVHHGGDGNADLDHELPQHVDHLVSEERRSGRREIMRRKLAEYVAESVCDRAQSIHGHAGADRDVRLLFSLRDFWRR